MDTAELFVQLRKLEELPAAQIPEWEEIQTTFCLEDRFRAYQHSKYHLFTSAASAVIHAPLRSGFQGIREVGSCIKNLFAGQRQSVKSFLVRNDPLTALFDQLYQHNSLKKARAGRLLLTRQLDILIHLIRCWRESGKQVVLLMAPYFHPKRLKDGYYQRVQAIDRMFDEDCLRIYASWIDADLRQQIMHCCIVDEHHIELTIPHPSQMFEEALVSLAKEASLVYHHSITFATTAVTTAPDILKIFDMHGAYPEEERLCGRREQAELDEEQEHLAMIHGDYAICVTQRMVDHLQAKYSDMKIQTLLLPIFDQEIVTEEGVDAPDDVVKPTVVYAGGMQKWQCIDEMQSLIRKTLGSYEFKIFTRDPEQFWKKWRGRRPKNGLLVQSREPQELRQEYKHCQYGLLLRKDIVVNHVACPTKLVEYLRYGIVPVMKTSQLGDFIQHGMQYVSAEDFCSGQIPTEDERRQMAEINRSVLKKLEDCENTGRRKLCELINTEKKPDSCVTDTNASIWQGREKP